MLAHGNAFAYNKHMVASIDSSWHCHFELKLRRTNGVAFQSFFSDVLETRHGSDFVRLKPQGSLGDKGCDGYLQSTGTVFACYGAQNGATGRQSALIGKIHDDFAKAEQDLKGIMNAWCWSHNLIEGMPADALLAFNKLQQEHPELGFEMFGPPRLRKLFEELSDDEREGFLGPLARRMDFFNLQVTEVRELSDALISAADTFDGTNASVDPVSPQKLEFNDIPAVWAQMIQQGRINARHIEAYFADHHDALRGERLAQVFRQKYLDLKAQKLGPGALMAELYALIAGHEAVPIERQVAAYSILAHLFESCDIFENTSIEDEA